jgi:hypothetical protein
MTHGLLAPLLTWWQLLVIALGLLALGELGFLLGRRHQGENVGEKKSQASVHVAALLGLLGLMLAFCFGIVESRYAERKALVLEEANSIGTTYLRAQMLPSPQAERIQVLLREYVDLRLGHRTPGELEQAIRVSGELQTRIWSEAKEVAAAHPQSMIVAIFIQSLNETFDLQESRITVALHQRLPLSILAMLYTIAALAIGVLGFGAGLGRTRSVLPTTALVLAITAVATLIVSLDSPGSHMFRVNQSAMQDLQQAMSRSIGPQTTARP